MSDQLGESPQGQKLTSNNEKNTLPELNIDPLLVVDMVAYGQALITAYNACGDTPIPLLSRLSNLREEYVDKQLKYEAVDKRDALHIVNHAEMGMFSIYSSMERNGKTFNDILVLGHDGTVQDARNMRANVGELALYTSIFDAAMISRVTGHMEDTAGQLNGVKLGSMPTFGQFREQQAAIRAVQPPASEG